MKSKLSILILMASLAGALGQGTYQNPGLVLCPPEVPTNIDATVFINSGEFIINFTNTLIGDLYTPTLGPVYETQNTLYYTNEFGALMSCNAGFNFNHFDSASARAGRSAVFHNDGDIHCGTSDTSNFFVFNADVWLGSTLYAFESLAGARMFVAADTIVNHGNIDMGFDSLLTFNGGAVDFTRGSMVEDTTGFSFAGSNFLSFFFNQSIFDGYWGIGDVRTQPVIFYPNGIDPNSFFTDPDPRTPFHPVTTRQGSTLVQSLGGPDYVSYIEDELDSTGSNRFTRVVFVSITNSEVAVNVYMPPNPNIDPGAGDILLEFTNITTQNGVNLYVQDDFGTVSNFSLVVDDIAGYRLPTEIPFDYTVFESTGFNPGAVASPPQDVPPGTYLPFGKTVTNQWQAYEALMKPVDYVQEDVYARAPTNGPGRIEMHATSDLNLSDSFISSQNYMLIEATNNFSGNTNAQIFSPIVDLNLRSAKGLLIISNLLAAQLPRYEGTLDLYSARWTNVVRSITNHYHVLFAHAMFSPGTPVRSQDVTLRTADPGGATDEIILSDLLTVTHSVLFDTSRMYITTNAPDANSPQGGVNFQGEHILWSDTTPRLQFLTNNGAILSVNAEFFGGNRTSPYYSSNFTEPYQVFINSGNISNFSSTIQANLFINSGSVGAVGGKIDLTSITAISTNGNFYAPSNSVSLTATSLVISNNPIIAGGALNLYARGLLDDGSLNPTGPDSADFVTNKNIWVTGNGFNLLSVPYGSASLLATTITNTAPPLRDVMIRSAARDLGCTPEGFDKDAAVGRVVLDGGDKSLFTFQAVNGNNAIYIDDLELYGYTTNYTNQTFYGMRVNPGMKVYYANASANGVIIADKLNGANNGAFCWVSNYNCGFFSSTNMVYPDGSTNRVNTALAEDCNVDSDNDGIVNCSDPSPIPPSASTCTPSPFPPVAIPMPATSASTTGGPAGSTNASSVVSAPKLGLPGAAESNGKATLLKGVFNGLFSDQSNGVATASSGYFTLAESLNGQFTAKLLLGGHTYSGAGIFGSTGSATVKFFSGKLPSVKGVLQLDATGSQVSGRLNCGSWAANVVADLHGVTQSKAKAGNLSGTYTLHIPGAAIGAGGPVGDGFGTVTIDQNGNVKFTGTMADGTKVNQTSVLSDDGYWPFYCSLYGGKGCAIGWFQVVETGTIGGELIWTKNPGADSKSYQSGFTNDVQAAGALYHKPSGAKQALDWSNGELTLTGGGLAGSTNSITLENNKATAADSKLQLDLISASGLFKGHIANPNGGTLQIQGALLQDVGYGFGYFINSGQSGQVMLAPRP